MMPANDADTLHIACAADGKYLPHCAAMLASVFAVDAPAKILVHFMHSPGMDRAARDQLYNWIREQGAEANFIAIPDEAVADLPRIPSIPQIMWYRVLLPILLPQLERILYLDADIVAMSSLLPLWETPLEGQWLAAVDNVMEPHVRKHPVELGLSSENDYFNSGVLLFNLKQMRADDCTAGILEFARNPKMRLSWPDQDALNIVLASRRVHLHPRWNCQNTLFFCAHGEHTFGRQTMQEAVSAPSLLHFEGYALTKPWNYMCTHPHRDLYWKFRAKTPWPQKRMDDFTVANALIRPLPIAWWPRAFRIKKRLRKLFG
jgi:lipopolysaccharide biosynthesis glycosyltransferase